MEEDNNSLMVNMSILKTTNMAYFFAIQLCERQTLIDLGFPVNLANVLHEVPSSLCKKTLCPLVLAM